MSDAEILLQLVEDHPELADLTFGEILSHFQRQADEARVLLEAETREHEEAEAVIKSLEPYMADSNNNTSQALDNMRIVEGVDADCVLRVEQWLTNHPLLKVEV